VRLNSIKPAAGSKPTAKRLGRGHGSGLGKTSGKGHKGQIARAGGYHKVGFEGGQLPLQRRLPKRGFHSHMGMESASVRLSELARVEGAVVDLAALKKANVVPAYAQRARVFLSGKVERAVTLKGIKVTKGAQAAIEKAGGKVEE
jgi:large subunit ribosomal protein L15